MVHLWRHVRGKLAWQAMQATTGLSKGAGAIVQWQVRRELSAAVRAMLDAVSEARAWEALEQLAGAARGAPLAALLRPHVVAAHVCHRPYTRALVRVSPEWCWRDFRLGLGHRRNHGTPARLERAALRWAIYHHFTPAQERRER